MCLIVLFILSIQNLLLLFFNQSTTAVAVEAGSQRLTNTLLRVQACFTWDGITSQQLWAWGKKNFYSVPKGEVDFTPRNCSWVWQKLTCAVSYILVFPLSKHTQQGLRQQGSAAPLPASSAAVLLDSCSSPAASNSLTKFEGNTPDLPL